MTPQNKRGYRKPRREVVGVKETDNLFMDGWSWRRFNNKIDEEMTKRGLPPQKTATFIHTQTA